MITVDPAVLSICARIASLFHGDDRPGFNESAELVSQLYADVMAGVEQVADSVIARHHLYAELGDRVLHCVYERIGSKWIVNFYVSEYFMAEENRQITLEFVGAHTNANSDAN